MMGSSALFGIIAAVTIPAFVQYSRRSKAAEAQLGLQKLSAASIAYYSTVRVDQNGTKQTPQFPKSAPLSPGNPAQHMCPDGGSRKFRATADTWAHETWKALSFSPKPSWYAYEYISSGAGPGSSFTARAYGDLDCDGILSTFEMRAQIDATGNVVKDGRVYINQEVE